MPCGKPSTHCDNVKFLKQVRLPLILLRNKNLQELPVSLSIAVWIVLYNNQLKYKHLTRLHLWEPKAIVNIIVTQSCLKIEGNVKLVRFILEWIKVFILANQRQLISFNIFGCIEDNASRWKLQV